MKKLFAVCCIVTSFLFMGCLTTNTTFGTEKQTQGNLVVSYDEFLERTTVDMKNDNIVNFKCSDVFKSFSIYPYFIYTDKQIDYRLVFRISGDTSKFENIIFITENGKYSFNFSSEKQKTGMLIPDNHYSAYVEGDYRITEEQYKILGEIINSANLKAAVYTIDNTVLEILEYGERAKNTYKELNDYLEENNLSELSNDYETEISIIKK